MPEDSPPNTTDTMDTASATLWSPPLAVLRDALEDGLSRNYRRAAVRVGECPDLRRLGCAWEGLGGAPCLVDVGGEPFAHDPHYRDVRFETEDLLRCAGHPGPQVLGAGMACSTTLGGHCGEVIANHDTRAAPASRAARVDERGQCRVEPYPSGRFAGLANLYLSRGEPGPVVEVEVAHRTGGEGSLPLAMRDALAPLAAEEGREIGLGGVFRVERGQVRAHVMPDYDRIGHEYYDAAHDRIVADFLRFFEPVGPGLLCFSVLWTGDPHRRRAGSAPVERAHPLLPPGRRHDGRALPLRRDPRGDPLPRLVRTGGDRAPDRQRLRPAAEAGGSA